LNQSTALNYFQPHSQPSLRLSSSATRTMNQGWPVQCFDRLTYSYEVRIQHLEDVVTLLLAKQDTTPSPLVPLAPISGSFCYSRECRLIPLLSKATARSLAVSQLLSCNGPAQQKCELGDQKVPLARLLSTSSQSAAGKRASSDNLEHPSDQPPLPSVSDHPSALSTVNTLPTV
jgi:hypothetical protein